MSAQDRTPLGEARIMGRALATAMGRQWSDEDMYGVEPGTWYLERADTQRPLYRLAERLEHGAVSHPISSAALSAQGLADALYFARLAVGMDRTERRNGS